MHSIYLDRFTYLPFVSFHFFLHFSISVWNSLPSGWETSLSIISFNTNIMNNIFPQRLSVWKTTLHYFCFESFFHCIWILDWHFILFQHFSNVSHCVPPSFHLRHYEVSVSLSYAPLTWCVCFSHTTFTIFPLPSVSNKFTMLYLDVFCFVFILSGISQRYLSIRTWIWIDTFHQLWEIVGLFVFKYCFCQIAFPFSTFGTPVKGRLNIFTIPTCFPQFFFPFSFFFSLYFCFIIFYCPFLQVTDAV